MLLNYRDEGDGGLLFRDYLRDTIPVEEEKMTHGHADENSIVMLASGGALLLHDGGYRDFMPSGPYGAYRQDYFHNRLCVRPVPSQNRNSSACVRGAATACARARRTSSNATAARADGRAC